MIDQTTLLGDLETLLAHRWSPVAGGLVLALAALRVFYRLRMVREHRLKMDDALDRAPGGTVITMDGNAACPAMKIEVGEGTRPDLRPIHIVVQPADVIARRQSRRL